MEFFWDGRWNTLSGYSWSQQEAQVVCAQLGLPSAAPWISYGTPYSATVDIAPSLNYWSCSGNESSLQECTPHPIDTWWLNYYASGDNFHMSAGEVSMLSRNRIQQYCHSSYHVQGRKDKM